MNKRLKFFIFLVSAIAIFYTGIALGSYSERSTVEMRERNGAVSSTSDQNIDINKLYNLVNEERTSNGIKPLVRSSLLDKSADAKCQDLATKNYWSHNAPNGTEPWAFIESAGVKYVKAGENLAKDYSSSEQVLIGWLNSPTHKQNLLDTEFSVVGYATCGNDKKIVVQHLVLE